MLLFSLAENPRGQLVDWYEDVQTQARSLCAPYDPSGAISLVAVPSVWQDFPGNINNPAEFAAGTQMRGITTSNTHQNGAKGGGGYGPHAPKFGGRWWRVACEPRRKDKKVTEKKKERSAAGFFAKMVSVRIDPGDFW